MSTSDCFGFTQVSGNEKTGKITVSRSNSSTCPPTCGMFFDCYGKYSHTRMHWQKVDNGEGTSLAWDKFLLSVAKKSLPMFRHNEVGDLPGVGDRIDPKRLLQLAKATKKIDKPYTYTHKPVLAGTYTVSGNVKKGQQYSVNVSENLAKSNREAIREANAQGFVINLSSDNLSQADSKADLDIAPVVTVLPLDASQGVRYRTPKGRKIVTCPATLEALADKKITCSDCGLCAVPNRKSIVGFPVHGAAKKRASDKLKIVA